MHQFGYHIDLLEEVNMRGLQDVQSRQNIFMLEKAEHLDFPINSLAGDEVLEDVGHLLERHALPIPGISHRPDNAERSVAYGSIWLNVAGHANGAR